MSNVTALVSQAIGPTPSLEGMLDTYKGYAARSRRERSQMKRELGYIKDETLFDTRKLFSLADAFRDNLTPYLGIAPYKATMLEYRAGWTEGKFYIAGDEFLAFNIPPGVRERIEANQRKKYMGMSDIERVLSRTSTSMARTVNTATVPPTPKALLPWNPLTRRKMHVLFDADWETVPVDPYLLERVNGHQYRVVAHWDLTEREREIMRLIAR